MSESKNIQNGRKALHERGLKECCDCRAVKPLAEFTRLSRLCAEGISGYAAACMPCRNLRNQKYRAANPERVKQMARESHVARVYGLSAEKYNELFASQNGCCAICLRHSSELKKSIAVDHNHETGAVRGLLCGECNAGIGMLGDDLETAIAAVEYLRRHKGDF